MRINYYNHVNTQGYYSFLYSFLFLLKLVTALFQFGWFFYLLCTLIHFKLSINCLKQWLKYGLWIPSRIHEVKTIFIIALILRHHVAFSVYVPFILMAQKHWWGKTVDALARITQQQQCCQRPGSRPIPHSQEIKKPTSLQHVPDEAVRNLVLSLLLLWLNSCVLVFSTQQHGQV